MFRLLNVKNLSRSMLVLIWVLFLPNLLAFPEVATATGEQALAGEAVTQSSSQAKMSEYGAKPGLVTQAIESGKKEGAAKPKAQTRVNRTRTDRTRAERTDQTDRTRARGRSSLRHHGTSRHHYYPYYPRSYGHFGYPYFSGHFYWGWPYYGYYSPFGPRYPAYYPSRWDVQAGAIDLNVKPKRTKVYLNGKFIGNANDFDGWPDYLALREGTYELIFYLDGHQTVRREYQIQPGRVIRERFEMQPGDSTPPQNLSKPPKAPVASRSNDDSRDRDRASGDSGQNEIGLEDKQVDMRGEPSRLVLDIQPDDATVYLDGQFLGTGRELGRLKKPLLVDSGNHLIEVVRPGYRAKSLTIEIPKGEVRSVKVDLSDQKE